MMVISAYRMMQTLHRERVRALLVIGVCLIGLLSTAKGKDVFVTTERRIAAYSTRAPHAQKGFFPEAAKLQIMEHQANGYVRVRFNTSNGRIIEALCRKGDLASRPQTPQKPATSLPAPSGLPLSRNAKEYKERNWLENAAGMKEGLSAARQFDIPLLLFFYADWNADCQLLWDELLNSSGFKNDTKNIVKVRINPEHGKEEGQLAADYQLRCYPTTLVLHPGKGDPRKIRLLKNFYGKTKCDDPEKALQKIWLDTSSATGTNGP
jgi:thiol-disulfide isomerase/thioredoxin